jgi:hypothetical protein
MTKATTTVKKKLAYELDEIAAAVKEQCAKGIMDDERQWAREAFETLVPKLRARAELGATSGTADISESDIVDHRGVKHLRGGGAALREILLDEGFDVELTHRFAGHPHGEFCLTVGWSR